jgi:lipopolysaccharide export system protein LptC
LCEKCHKEQKSADFKGYALEVKSSDGSQLQKYRTDSLTTREKGTYVKIDSLVKSIILTKK